jgi:uncharacterized protein
MTEPIFNPFEDRLSRDIRNDLSAGLALAVETGDGDTLAETVARYRQQPLARCYLTYLEDRCTRYETALEAINAGITDPIQRSVILWNLGLFFEVHEVLEHAWYTAEGNRKQTLQALIRAAGVYIKREYGFHDSARRIAAKAIPVLEENRAILEDYFEPGKLISALAAPDVSPPKLL